MNWQPETDWNRLLAMEALGKRSLEFRPRSPEAVAALLNVQKALGDGDGMRRTIDRVSLAFGDDAAERKQFIELLVKVRARDRELEEAQKLVSTFPTDPEARALFQRALAGSKGWGHVRARAGDDSVVPSAAELSLADLVEFAHSEHDLQYLITRCRHALADRPSDTDARYFLALALADCGRNDEARAVMAMDELTCVGELGCPERFESAEAFRAALIREILAHSTLSRPTHYFTANGFKTSRLGFPGQDAAAVLSDALKAAVEEWVAGLQ